MYYFVVYKKSDFSAVGGRVDASSPRMMDANTCLDLYCSDNNCDKNLFGCAEVPAWHKNFDFHDGCFYDPVNNITTYHPDKVVAPLLSDPEHPMHPDNPAPKLAMRTIPYTDPHNLK